MPISAIKKMRRFALTLLLAAVPLADASELNIVGLNICPFSCDSDEVGRDGFLVDIIRDALAGAGYTVNFRTEPLARALAMVRSGQADGIAAIYVSDAPDLVHGQATIYTNITKFFVRRGSSWRYDGKGNWDELLVAVTDSYSFDHEDFDQYVSEAKNTRSDKVIRITGNNVYKRMAEMLLSGRVNAVVGDPAFIYFGLSQALGETTDYIRLPITSAGELNRGNGVVAMTPVRAEKSAELLAIIDRFVTDLYSSGEINDYTRRYGVIITENGVMPADR